MNKTNSKYKVQSRGIVVTNMNIYKHDPKNFKVANKPIPIAEIIDVTLYGGHDQWVVIHTSEKQQDLLFDLSICSKIEEEKASEFVTVLCQTYKQLTQNDLPIKFEDKSTFKCKAKKSIPISFEVTDSPTPTCKVSKKPAGLILSSRK